VIDLSIIEDDRQQPQAKHADRKEEECSFDKHSRSMRPAGRGSPPASAWSPLDFVGAETPGLVAAAWLLVARRSPGPMAEPAPAPTGPALCVLVVHTPAQHISDAVPEVAERGLARPVDW